MNILLTLRHRFYSVVRRRSICQIQEDFGGEFPFPLKCINIEGEFDIVRARGLGILYRHVQRSRDLLALIESGQQLLASGDPSVKEFEQTILKCRLLLDGAKKGGRLLNVFYPVFRGILLISLMRTLARSKLNRNEVLGYAQPLLPNQTQTIFLAFSSEKTNNVAAVISHEHLHLLQAKSLYPHTRNPKNADLFVIEQYASDQFFLYLLKSVEVEARLHEIVLSYYVVSKELPVTLDSFLDLLSGNHQFGWVVIQCLEANGRLKNKDIVQYESRGIVFAEQLEYVFLYLKDDFLYPFITEVLPVMYGNLLKYYGDATASEFFLRGITRPNLYDLIYAD